MFRWFPTNTCTKDVLEYAVCTIKFIECIRIIIKNLNKSSLKLFVIRQLLVIETQCHVQRLHLDSQLGQTEARHVREEPLSACCIN